MVEKNEMNNRVILALSMCLLCCSCGVTIHPEPKLPAPIIESYPLTVVLYLKPAFKNSVATIDSLYDWRIDLGSGSVEILIKTLNVLFYRVIIVEKAEDFPKSFSVVIEPDVHDFSLHAEQGIVEIAYNFKLFDHEKQLIDKLQVTGQGKRQQLYKLDIIKDSSETAMKDAMAQLIVKIQNDPNIQTWFRTNRENNPNDELK